MQILSLILYGKNGKMFEHKFNLGKLNIITGGSKTGKSAIIEIIDFCLGKAECHVPAGIIRDSILWYGLLLKFASDQVFVARKVPQEGRYYSTEAYFEYATTIQIPAVMPESGNTTFEALVDFLSQRLMISANRFDPPAGQTRRPFGATIRHALVFCFQQYEEIASKKQLFHSQNEPFMNQTIKDVIPYFLGALREDELALKQELQRLNKELRISQEELIAAEALRGQGLGRLNILINELQEAGLLKANFAYERNEDVIAEFRRLLTWSPSSFREDNPRIEELQHEIHKLKNDLIEANSAISAAQEYASEAVGYVHELTHQRHRLESINLYNSDIPENKFCPLCSQTLETEQTTSKAIRSSLDALSKNLESASREQPYLRDHINTLKNKAQDIKDRIQVRSETIELLIREKENSKRLNDENLRRAQLIGKVKFWLDGVDEKDNLSPLREKVSQLETRIKAIESDLDRDEVESRINEILARISIRMTEWAKQFDLEYDNKTVRLDYRKATVVVDIKNETIPLNRMGSSHVILSYHLIALFALHEYFIKNGRPVPRFLILDQPSQAYHPSEKDKEEGTTASLPAKERNDLANMYKFVSEVTRELSPEFQVIVMDHAHLNEKFFEDSVIEVWRGGPKLVPDDWLGANKE